ncbi:MAG: nuclear transport factor 2 family protein [Gammaproteobacteria bacterium]
MKSLVLTGVLLMGGALMGNAVAADMGAKSGSLEARLQKVEDHIEIERLLMEYGVALDKRDFAAYSKLFAKTGTWSGSTGTFTGPAEIQAAMEKSFGPTVKSPMTPGSFHVLTNAIIDIDGDKASALSKWTFIALVEKKPVIAIAGVYQDTFVRENGKWKFQSRLAPAVTAGAPPPPAK